MTKKKHSLEKPLTEVELELMRMVWQLGECTVKEVQTALAQERELAYTSVATIMKILEQKGALESQKTDRAHLYRPRVSRADYEAASLRHLADHVFQGNPSSMVMRLLDESKLSQIELESIRRLLEEKLQ
ncbi:MAG: BlaI/MecI/CopY family transcriptional regulator [Bdellovibrionota bacterium]